MRKILSLFIAVTFLLGLFPAGVLAAESLVVVKYVSINDETNQIAPTENKGTTGGTFTITPPKTINGYTLADTVKFGANDLPMPVNGTFTLSGISPNSYTLYVRYNPPTILTASFIDKPVVMKDTVVKLSDLVYEYGFGGDKTGVIASFTPVDTSAVGNKTTTITIDGGGGNILTKELQVKVVSGPVVNIQTNLELSNPLGGSTNIKLSSVDPPPEINPGDGEADIDLNDYDPAGFVRDKIFVDGVETDTLPDTYDPSQAHSIVVVYKDVQDPTITAKLPPSYPPSTTSIPITDLASASDNHAIMKFTTSVGATSIPFVAGAGSVSLKAEDYSGNTATKVISYTLSLSEEGAGSGKGTFAITYVDTENQIIGTESVIKASGTYLYKSDLTIPADYTMVSVMPNVNAVEGVVTPVLIYITNSNASAHNVIITYLTTSSLSVGIQFLNKAVGSKLTLAELKIPTGYELVSGTSTDITIANAALNEYVFVVVPTSVVNKVTTIIQYVYGTDLVGSQTIQTDINTVITQSSLTPPEGYVLSTSVFNHTATENTTKFVMVQPTGGGVHQCVINYLKNENGYKLAEPRTISFISGNSYEAITSYEVNGYRLNHAKVNGIDTPLTAKDRIKLEKMASRDYVIDFYYVDYQAPTGQANSSLLFQQYAHVTANQLVWNVADNSGYDIKVYYKPGNALDTTRMGKQNVVVVLEDPTGNKLEITVPVEISDSVECTITIKYQDKETKDIVGTQYLYGEVGHTFYEDDLRPPYGYQLEKKTWSYKVKTSERVYVSVIAGESTGTNNTTGRYYIDIEYIDRDTGQRVGNQTIRGDRNEQLYAGGLTIPSGYKLENTSFTHRITADERLTLYVIKTSTDNKNSNAKYSVNIRYTYWTDNVGSQTLTMDANSYLQEKDLNIPSGYRLLTSYIPVQITYDGVQMSIPVTMETPGAKGPTTGGTSAVKNQMKTTYYVQSDSSGKLYPEIGVNFRAKIVSVGFSDGPIESNGLTVKEKIAETATYRTYSVDGGTSKEDLGLTGYKASNMVIKPSDAKLSFVNKDGSYVYVSANGKIYLSHEVNAKHSSYMDGYPDGTFGTDRPITRAEYSQILYKSMNDGSYTPKATAPFSDTSGHWAQTAIEFGYEIGALKGYPDGTFKPDQPITKAEVATVANKFMCVGDVPPYTTVVTDVSGHWAEAFIKQVHAQGYMGVNSSGEFKPDIYLTRGEMTRVTNHILSRVPAYRGTISFSDVNASNTYYYDIGEATQTHTHN